MPGRSGAPSARLFQHCSHTRREQEIAKAPGTRKSPGGTHTVRGPDCPQIITEDEAYEVSRLALLTTSNADKA